MSISKKEFKDAFRTVMSQEFEDILYNEPVEEHIFSQKFEHRMNKIIRAEKKKMWHWYNTVTKKVAIIIITLTILITTVSNVDAIRTPIVNFFVEVYESFSHYFLSGDLKEKIDYEYHLSSIPSGFYETNVIYDSTRIVHIYESDNKNVIELSQTITDSIDLYVDNEHGTINKIFINDVEINIYISDGCTQAIWISDSYLLMLTYYGNIDLESMTELIKLVQ